MKSGISLLGLLLFVSLAAAGPSLLPFSFSEARITIGDDPAYARADFDDSAWPRRDWSEVSERGIWWFRRHLEMPEAYREGNVPIGLYIFGAASAEVWWDGQPVGSKGRAGATPDSELPGPMDDVVSFPPELLTPGEHVLAIRFSSQHAGSGIATPVDAVFFAPYGSPLRYFQDRYRPSLLLGGGLGLAAMFLMVMWVRERQRDVAWLLLASTSALAQLAVEVSRAIIQYPYPWHEWRLYGIGVAAALGGIGLLGHLLQRFKLPGSRYWIGGVSLAAAGLLLSGIPAGMATWLIMLIWLSTGVIICTYAVWHGHDKAWVGIVGLGWMLAAMVASPNAFTDRTYFLGLVVLLLIIFADTIRNHARIRRERDEARNRLGRLELELLKRQLRPHFLMNTLTTLSEWLETDPRIASRMIDALASEFRMLNRVADQRLIPLDDELSLCRAHLDVMSYRQERQYELRVQGDTGIEIPPAAIHTLLENALTHADPNLECLQFDLTIAREEGRATLTLACPSGRGPTTDETREGTGLGYVRARLKEAFGESARIDSGPTRDGWTTRIEIPAVVAKERTAPSDADPGHHQAILE